MSEFAPFDLAMEMASIVGLELAMKIIGARGGTRMHFAREPRPGNWLAQLIGLENASALGAHLCGSNASIQLDVPIGRRRRDFDRWNTITAMLPTKSNAEIARAVGCHYKTVQRIRNGKRLTVTRLLTDESRQGKLF